MSKLDRDGLEGIRSALREISTALSRHIEDADRRAQKATGTDLQEERLIRAGLVQAEETINTADEHLEITLAPRVPKREYPKRN